ncbi:MAG: hypothetical protein AAF098_07090 [Pseudomonadota bacterium]
MGDSDKTKEELLAEIAALRAKMEAGSADAGAEPSEPKSSDTSDTGITRREVLATAWVAPVILTVPLAASVSPRAFAQPATSVPTVTPPTSAPTTAPTLTPPTAAPTAVPAPPTSFPTAAPTAGPPVTVAPPTAFPTVAPEPIPVEISGFDIS